MSVNEINTFDINNNPISSLETNNIALSDELFCIEGNKDESLYAKNKRLSSSLKKGAVILTLSVSVFTGAATLSNALLGSDPIINNFSNSIIVNENALTYNFDISIENSSLRMDLIYLSDVIYTYTFSTSGTYVENINLSQKGQYVIKFFSSNLFDYERELNDYRYTFII